MDRDGVREAVDGFRNADLLVRRHRPRRRARAEVVAASLQGWRGLEAGRRAGGIRNREGRLQHDSLRAGHDDRAPPRARDAAERLRRRAGVEGEIGSPQTEASERTVYWGGTEGTKANGV